MNVLSIYDILQLAKSKWIVVLTTLILCSCSAYYIPTTQNVPLFEEKNQATLMAGYEAGEYSKGLDVQGAYSFTNHFAATTSFYFGEVYGDLDNLGNFNANDFQSNRYQHLEFALGYYTNLGASRGIFEVYGGYGTGEVRWNEKELQKAFQYNQFFIQPQIGGHLGKVDLAFSTRLNYAVWPSFSQVFIEPGLTFRIGFDVVKIHMQIVKSESLTSPSGSSSTNSFEYEDHLFETIWNSNSYETIHASIGLYFPLGFKSK